MEKETSCINSKAILDYFLEHNDGNISVLVRNLHPELDDLPDPVRFLQDPNHWISCEVITTLYQRAEHIFNDRLIAFKIARHAVENATLGYLQRVFVKSFGSTTTVLKHLQQINDKFNRNKRVELVELKKTAAVVRLHWNTGMKVSRQICLNNQGIFTYLPLVWNARPLALTENCCFFRGGPYCEYHLKWPRRNRIHEIVSKFFASKFFLLDTIREMEQDKRIIEQKYEEVNHLNARLNRKMKQMTALQETGKAILSILDIEQLLKTVMNILFDACHVERISVMLVDPERKYLEYVHGVGFPDEIAADMRSCRIPLNRPGHIMARVTQSGQSEYVPNVRRSTLGREDLAVLNGKSTALFVAPLIARSRVIGVIVTDTVAEFGIPEETRETLEVFTSQIAVAIDNAKLYTRLQEQMAALKQSNALLNRVEKFSFLGNLAARLAHEIKNPMTAIGAFLQLLPTKYDDEEFRNGFYQVAWEETARVNNLITELLELVHTRESEFESSDLHILIDKMILLVSPQSKAKKIQIVRRFDYTLGPVWMDPEKIKQTLLNLLSNAVDFTPVRGIIELSTRRFSGKSHPGGVQIEIKDTGPGIPRSLIDNIFDPYFTTRHKSSRHNGTGLGLFIAHQHIRDHAGSIDVVSEPGRGAAFKIKLPFRPLRSGNPASRQLQRKTPADSDPEG